MGGGGRDWQDYVPGGNVDRLRELHRLEMLENEKKLMKRVDRIMAKGEIYINNKSNKLIILRNHPYFSFVETNGRITTLFMDEDGDKFYEEHTKIGRF